MRFRPEQHLRRQADFDRVRSTGRRYDAGAFTVFYAPRPPVAAPDDRPSEPANGDTTGPAPVRAGFVASRSAVGNAVARARAKRRLREGFRAHQTAFPAGFDFIFVARRMLNGLEHPALQERFSTLCRKLSPSPRAT
ncbi:MAG: ribonuclease P protein component [Opitutaceae bacterium]|nr:ribonuclease P protein component [Opitutaceae bacterium]